MAGGGPNICGAHSMELWAYLISSVEGLIFHTANSAPTLQ